VRRRDIDLFGKRRCKAKAWLQAFKKARRGSFNTSFFMRRLGCRGSVPGAAGLCA
jgi:hypothetical protein